MKEDSVETVVQVNYPKRRGPKPKTPLTTKMTELVQMRWDAAKADDNSIRRRYGKELSVPDALEELAALRKLCEIAAKEVNQRLNHEGQICKSCRRKMDGTKPPVLTEPLFDVKTGTYYNNFYCSIPCVQMRNLKKLGREELIK